jgi:hypothetical protein
MLELRDSSRRRTDYRVYIRFVLYHAVSVKMEASCVAEGRAVLIATVADRDQEVSWRL